MIKVITPLLLCVPLAYGISAEINSNAISPEEKYIDEIHVISPEMGMLISDISNVRKHNCNETMSIKSMQYTLANDEFVFDSLRKNASDSSYLGSDAYRNALNKTYKQCS